MLSPACATTSTVHPSASWRSSGGTRSTSARCRSRSPRHTLAAATTAVRSWRMPPSAKWSPFTTGFATARGNTVSRSASICAGSESMAPSAASGQQCVGYAQWVSLLLVFAPALMPVRTVRFFSVVLRSESLRVDAFISMISGCACASPLTSYRTLGSSTSFRSFDSAFSEERCRLSLSILIHRQVSLGLAARWNA